LELEEHANTNQGIIYSGDYDNRCEYVATFFCETSLFRKKLIFLQKG